MMDSNSILLKKIISPSVIAYTTEKVLNALGNTRYAYETYNLLGGSPFFYL